MVFMYTLGIETSCDETGVAIYHATKGLLAHKLHSQIALHAKYGGVVPELASRDQNIRKVLPLLKEALGESKLQLNQIDGIAYTAGPGLIGALLVGAAIGKSLGFALGIPSIGVHHMVKHIYYLPCSIIPNIISLYCVTSFRRAYIISSGKCFC